HHRQGIADVHRAQEATFLALKNQAARGARVFHGERAAEHAAPMAARAPQTNHRPDCFPKATHRSSILPAPRGARSTSAFVSSKTPPGLSRIETNKKLDETKRVDTKEFVEDAVPAP